MPDVLLTLDVTSNSFDETHDLFKLFKDAINYPIHSIHTNSHINIYITISSSTDSFATYNLTYTGNPTKPTTSEGAL